MDSVLNLVASILSSQNLELWVVLFFLMALWGKTEIPQISETKDIFKKQSAQ